MTLELVLVKYVPNILEEGKIYISEEYKTSSHLCPCGCGQKVVLPFYMWTHTIKDGKLTTDPSIGNYKYECKSHYNIINNEVIFAP